MATSTLRSLMMAASRLNLSDKGQSLVETLMFIPLLLGMLTSILAIAGAINNAINQQKVVRGYFFNRIGGNSYAPRAGNVDDISRMGVKNISMLIYGWTRIPIVGSQVPVGQCHKMINIMGKGDAADTCDRQLGDVNQNTQQIRIHTVYGICSANYFIDGDGQQRRKYSEIGDAGTGCQLSN